jgi:GLPGLI family protein
MQPYQTKAMKCKLVCLFILFCFFGFSQDRVNRTYKFSIQSITTYQQAKPHYDEIRLVFSENKSVNHLLSYDSNESTFKVQSTINFNRESLRLELEEIGLVLREFYVDGTSEE